MEYRFQLLQQPRIDELEICRGFRRLQMFRNGLGKSLSTKFFDLVAVLIAYNCSQFLESYGARPNLCRSVRHEIPLERAVRYKKPGIHGPCYRSACLKFLWL